MGVRLLRGRSRRPHERSARRHGCARGWPWAQDRPPHMRQHDEWQLGTRRPRQGHQRLAFEAGCSQSERCQGTDAQPCQAAWTCEQASVGRERRACAGASADAPESGADLLEKWQCWPARRADRGANRRGDGDGDRRFASDGARQAGGATRTGKRDYGSENQYDCRTRRGAEDHTRRSALLAPDLLSQAPALSAALNLTACGACVAQSSARTGVGTAQRR